MAGNVARHLTSLVMLLPLGACNAILGPTRPDTNWRVVDSAHFALHVRPGSFAEENAEQLAEILDGQYEHTRRVLDLAYNGRISAFLYNSQTDVEPSAPSNRSGVGFPDTDAIGVVCVPPLDLNLAVLLMHEANHVIMGRGIGRKGTSFMNEGMASAVMSPMNYPEAVTGIHAWARRNRAHLLPIRDLTNDDTWDDFPGDLSYKTSASFLLFVLERYGPAAVRELYTVPSEGFERRVEEVVGRSLDRLESDWLEFLTNGPGM